MRRWIRSANAVIEAWKSRAQMDITTPLRHGPPLHNGAWSKRRATSTMRRDGHAKYWSAALQLLAGAEPSRRHAGPMTVSHPGALRRARIEYDPSGVVPETAV